MSKIPGGLHPERSVTDGTPIEHTIEPAPDESPFLRRPLPLTVEEHEIIKEYIADLMDKG